MKGCSRYSIDYFKHKCGWINPKTGTLRLCHICRKRYGIMKAMKGEEDGKSKVFWF